MRKQLLNEKPFLGRDSPPGGGSLKEDRAAIEVLADVIICLVSSRYFFPGILFGYPLLDPCHLTKQKSDFLLIIS